MFQYAELDPPSINDQQVLVEVHAAGVNPIDTKVRAAPERFPVTLPCIPGCDAAGIVVDVGKQVTQFHSGDEVYFSQPGFNERQGTYAEQVAVDAELVALKPRTLSFEQAVAAPLVCITAWEALYDRTRLQAGQTVLIHAGAGGVGHVAIKLAKIAGACVITTVSGDDKANFAKSLGADEVLDYKTQDLVDGVMAWTKGVGVDIAFDTVGSHVLQSTFTCVKPYGDVVSLLQPTTDTDWREARNRNLRFSFELMLSAVMLEMSTAKQHQAEILSRCANLIDEGKLSVHVNRTFPLEQAAAAHDFLEQQHPIGKIVLGVRPPFSTG